MLHASKQNVVLKEVLTENKLFYLSKGALHAGTAHNKWLKEALAIIGADYKSWL